MNRVTVNKELGLKNYFKNNFVQFPKVTNEMELKSNNITVLNW